MTTYTFKGPNGRIVKLNGPANATAAEKGAALRAYLAAHPEPDATKPAESLGQRVVGALKAAGGVATRFTQGVDASLLGLVPGALDSRVGRAIAGTPAERGTAGAIGEFVGDTAQYAAGGEILKAPLTASEVVAKLGPKAAERIGTMLSAGAVSGLHGRTPQSALTGAALAGVGEAGAAGVKQAATRFAAPLAEAARHEMLALAHELHVPVSLGDLIDGKVLSGIKSALSRLPATDIARMGKRQTDALLAAVKKVARIPDDSPVTRDTVHATTNALSREYDALWSRTHTDIGTPQADALRDMYDRIGGSDYNEGSGTGPERASVRGTIRRIMWLASGRRGQPPAGPYIPLPSSGVGHLDGDQLHSLLKGDLDRLRGSSDAAVAHDAAEIQDILQSGMPAQEQPALKALDSRRRDLYLLDDALSDTAGKGGDELRPHKLAAKVSRRYGVSTDMQKVVRLAHLLRPPAGESATMPFYLLFRGAEIPGSIIAAESATRHPEMIAPTISAFGIGSAVGNALNSKVAANAYQKLAAAGLKGSTQNAIRRALVAGAPASATPNR